jgi:hypothetical protein
VAGKAYNNKLPPWDVFSLDTFSLENITSVFQFHFDVTSIFVLRICAARFGQTFERGRSISA